MSSIYQRCNQISLLQYSSILLHIHLRKSMNVQEMTSIRLNKVRTYSMIGLLLCYTCLHHKEYIVTVSSSLVMSSTSLHYMMRLKCLHCSTIHEDKSCIESLLIALSTLSTFQCCMLISLLQYSSILLHIHCIPY